MTSSAPSGQPRGRSALILYATTEGQTAKIAHFVSNLLAKRGVKIDLHDTADMPPRFRPDGYDRIFLAGSVHAGRHQRALEAFVRKHAEALDKTHTMFISVSLAAAGDKTERKEALALAWKFVDSLGWKPTVVLTVAGALRFTQYDFFRRWIMSRLAREKGLETNGVEDMEFTDWPALERAAVKFMGTH